MIKSFMGLVDDILYEFKGQLRLEDIYQLTYKELAYLREHRMNRLKDKNAAQNEALQGLIGG
jgi:hypothetical protein